MAFRTIKKYWDMLYEMFFKVDDEELPSEAPVITIRPTDSELMKELRSRGEVKRMLKCQSALPGSHLSLHSFPSGSTVDTIPLTSSYNLRCYKCPHVHRRKTLKRENEARKIRKLRKMLTLLLKEEHDKACKRSKNRRRPQLDQEL